jgi:rubredoxin
VKKGNRKFHKTVLKCPMCGSTDLYLESGGIAGYVYHCKNCDYIGAFVIEEEIEWEEDDHGKGSGDSEKEK